MKRLFIAAMLATCLLASSALAQTIPEQVAAPERAQGTWHSPSGRTTVTMDAKVIVPDIASIPLVEVFPRIFEPTEAYALAEALIGKGAWQAYIDLGSDKQHRDDAPQPGYQTGAWLGRDLMHHSLVLGGGGSDQNSLPLKVIYASFTDGSNIGQTQVMVSMSYQYQQGDNIGRNVGAQENAVELASSLVTGIWPDMQFMVVDKDLDITIDRASREGRPADYGYRIYFARMLHGVTITPVMQQGAGDATHFFPGKNQPSYHLPLEYERLFVDVGEDGIFQIRYDNPLRVGQVLEETPVLLPFPQILDVFSKLSPLKYAAFEQASNNGIQINRVVLGYMCQQMKDQPGRHQMVPVWDFFGSRTIDRELYDETNNSLFTINAIDGTVIDRDLGY